MSQAFAVEAIIDRSADEVWTALTDWNRAEQWMAGIHGMRADGATGTGTQLTFYARGKERKSEIVSCERGRSVVLRSVQGSVTAEYAYRIHRIEDGRTKVTLVADCRTQGLLWRAISPVLRLAVRHADGGQLKALKTMVETGRTPDHGTSRVS